MSQESGRNATWGGGVVGLYVTVGRKFNEVVVEEHRWKWIHVSRRLAAYSARYLYDEGNPEGWNSDKGR